jgi:hypothetical protein
MTSGPGGRWDRGRAGAAGAAGEVAAAGMGVFSIFDSRFSIGRYRAVGLGSDSVIVSKIWKSLWRGSAQSKIENRESKIEN